MWVDWDCQLTHAHPYKIDVHGAGEGEYERRAGLGGGSPLQRFAARFQRFLFRFFCSSLANLSLSDKNVLRFYDRRNATTSATTLPVLVLVLVLRLGL